MLFILMQETSIRATKYLPAIVRLQRYLYDTHNCRCSRTEIRAKTIGSFIKEFNDGIDLVCIVYKLSTHAVLFCFFCQV